MKRRRFGSTSVAVGASLSSSRVAHLLDALDEAVLVLSREHRVLWANAQARGLLGIPDRESLLDRPVRNLFAAYPALLAWLERTNAPRPVESQFEVHTSQGPRYWRVRQVRIQHGPQAGGRILYLQDITERHQDTQRLQQRLRRTRWMSQLLEKAFQPVHRVEVIHQVLELFLHPFDDWELRGAALYVQHSAYPVYLLIGVAGLNREDLREELPADQIPLQETFNDGTPVLREPLPLQSWALPLRLERGRPAFLWLAAEAQRPAPTAEQRNLLQQAVHLLALFLRSLAALHERLRLSRSFEHDVDGLIIFRLRDLSPVFGNPVVPQLLGRDWRDPQLLRELLSAFPQGEALPQALRQGQRPEALYQGTTPQGLVSLRLLAFALTVPPEEEPSYGVLTLQDLTSYQHTITELERQSEFTEHLLHLSESMLQGRLRLADVLRRILRTTQNMVKAEGGSLILVDENQVPYAVFTGQDLYPPSEFTTQALQQGLAGWVLRHRTAVVIEDVTQDKRWVAGGYQEWRSALSVPIYYGETPLAVLTLTHTQPGHFQQEQLELLQAAADLMAPALYTARLYEEQYFLTQQLAAAREEAETLHRREQLLVQMLYHALEPAVEHLRQEWEHLHENFLHNQQPLPESLAFLWESWQELERLLALLQPGEHRYSVASVAAVPVAALFQRLEALLRPLLYHQGGLFSTAIHPPGLTLETYEHPLFYLLFRLTYEWFRRSPKPQLHLQARQENGHVLFSWYDPNLVLNEEERRLFQMPDPGAQTEEAASTPEAPGFSPPFLASLQARLFLEDRPGEGVVLYLRLPLSLSPQSEQTSLPLPSPSG